jgi:hypothetical protein
MNRSQNSSAYFLETKRIKTPFLGTLEMLKIGEIVKSLERRNGDYYYFFIETLPRLTSWCIGIRSETNKLEAQEKRMGKFKWKRLYINFSDLIPPLTYEPVKIFVSLMADGTDGVWGDENEDFAGVILNEPRETCLMINPRVKDSERILRNVLHRI